MLRTYGFLHFLLQRYPGDQATFLLINSDFAPNIVLFYLFIYVFVYLFMYEYIYLFIYFLFIPKI